MGARVSARDVDGFPLTYSIGNSGDAAAFTIVSSTGQLRTRAALDREVKSTYTFTVTVRDATNLSDTQSVTVTVEDVPEAPYFPSSETGERSVPENAANRNVGSPVAARNVDGFPLEYSIDNFGDAAAFTIVSSTGQLRTRAGLDHEVKSTYTFTVTVRDATNLSDTQSVTVTVTDVNEPPDITDGPTSASYEEGGTASVATYTATDPDGDPITWSLPNTTFETDRSDFSISGIGELSFNRTPNYESPHDSDRNNVYRVTVRASDGSLSASRNVTVTVTNRSPIIDSGLASISYAEGRTDLAETYAASDPGGGTISWSLPNTSFETDRSDFSISGSGALSFDSSPDYESPHDSNQNNVYKITVRASDGSLSASRNVTVTVTNRSPIIDSGLASISYAEGRTDLAETYAASDPGGGAISWSLPNTSFETDRGDFDISSSGSLTFDDIPDYENPDDHNNDNVYKITVRASDGILSTSRNVTVTVTDVDECPERMDRPDVSPPNTTVTDDLLVTWDEPGNTGPPITGYAVLYKAADAASYKIATANTPNLEWTLTGLTENTEYKARVRAMNAECDSGLYSEPGAGTTNAVPVPTVSIRRHSSMPAPPEGIEEGTTARFVVTASASSTTGLTVNILLFQEKGRQLLPIDASMMRTATIRSPGTAGELLVLTQEDNLDEMSGNITAILQPGTGYTVTADADRAQAVIRVNDDEMPGTPTNVGANGKVEYAFAVWDSFDYRDHTVTPTDLEPYTPTVLPQVWWAPSKYAYRYQVLINRENCGNSRNDLVPVTCRMVDPDDPTIVERKGGAIIQSSPVSIPKGSYELSLLYAVRVRALDIEGNMSAPSEPVYMLPLHQRPKELQLVPQTVYFQVATASLFAYFPVAEFVDGKIPYSFTVCQNTIPSNLNNARIVGDIERALKTWHAIEQSFGKSLLHVISRSTPPAGACPESEDMGRDIPVEEVRFGDTDDWRAFSCFPEADGCYRTWSHTLGDLGQDESAGSAKLIPLINGRILLRSVPKHVDSWTSRAQTHQNGCTALEHVVAHEFVHGLGIGFPDFDNLSRLTHPYLESNSLGSTVAEGHIKYCRPYPHDMVAVMAIHQHFNSALTIRDLDMTPN